MKRHFLAAAALALCALPLAGCNDDDAKVAGENLTKAADNFEVTRRVVMVNTLTDKYLLEIIGRCSFGPSTTTPKTVNVICKTGPNDYKKHSLVSGDNTAIVVEQMAGTDVSVNFYRVTFKPTVILPDIDVRGPGLDQDTKR